MGRTYLSLKLEEEVKIAFKQPVLHDAIFLILALDVELCRLGADFARSGEKLIPVELQNPSSRRVGALVRYLLSSVIRIMYKDKAQL